MFIKYAILVIITIMPFTFGFIAYDCDGPAQNITSFDSLEVDNCDFPIASNTQQVPRLQLLQRIETYPVHFKSCLITVDYLITRCSIFEDAQLVEGGYFSDVVDLGSARCSEIHQKRSYTFPLGGIVTDLQMNETTLTSHTVAGSLDRFGNCRGTNFKSSRGEWENVVVQAKFKIYLSEGTAIANSKDNILILPSGTKMKLSDNYGIDTFKGETVWTNNHFNCEEQDFVVLFDGPASLITSTTTDNYRLPLPS